VPHTTDDLKQYGSTAEPTTQLLPDEEVALEAQLVRVREEKRLALLEPGPTWSQWFFFRAAKWYVIVAFLIALSWELGYLFPPSNSPADEVLPVVAATVYAEFLLYRCLWYRPTSGGPSRSTRDKPFRRSLIRPVRYGRWTPEGADVRAGRPVVVPAQGPDPREFL
jgi:hypothetical protein